MEQTKRGEKDREREEEAVQGEPVDTRPTGQAGTHPVGTTRDKGVEPSRDERRDGRGEDTSA